MAGLGLGPLGHGPLGHDPLGLWVLLGPLGSRRLSVHAGEGLPAHYG
jgi:hypothetical protein